MSNNLFEQQNSSTILKPRPGSRRGGSRPANENHVQQPQSFSRPQPVQHYLRQPAFQYDGEVSIPDLKKNYLLLIATPLLSLASRLGCAVSHDDVIGLREKLSQSCNDFTHELLLAGYTQETVADSSYAICTLLDELVLNTPWGGHSHWGTQTLLSQFHGEAWGGENFFSKLYALKIQPANNLDILELYYLCLSLGLQGRFRVLDNGRDELKVIRDDLYQIISSQKGGYEKALSAHWKGVQNLKKTLIHHTPWWVAAVLTSAVLLVVYLFFLYMINVSADPQYRELDYIARDNNPLATEFITLVEYVPEYIEPVAEIQLEKRKLSLKELLAAEIEQGLIDVFDVDGDVVIRTRGLFVSGNDQIMPQMQVLIDRIAEQLNDMKGKILVSGHTDNVPIFSVRFPSNWVLSKARAEQVMHALEKEMNGNIRFASEGRADKEPVIDNNTAKHRALNRRVEIIVTERI